MPFQSLHHILPELVEAETRAIILPSDDNDFKLPAGRYLFVELFCDEPGCDCRRVMFSVFFNNQKEALATIGYGWESAGFMQKEFSICSI